MINETVTKGTVREGILSRNGITAVQRLVAVLCAVLILPAGICAQSISEQQAFDSLYSLDFDTAERFFRDATLREPANAAHWNRLASVVWLRLLYEQQKLDLETYSGADSFGTRSSKDAVKPADEQRLRDAVRQAVQASEAALKREPKSVQALYSLGVSHGMIASFEATAKRSYFNAYRAARRARDAHQEVLRIDPSFHDARLVLGIYEYAIGSIPRWARVLLLIWGGDKAKGIQNLEMAASKGKTVAVDAQMLLTVVYNREKQWEKSLQTLKSLHGRYPRNFVLELSTARVYQHMKRFDQSVEVYESVLRKCQERSDGYDRLRPEQVLYPLGRANIEGLHLDAAVDAFERVVRSRTATDNEKAQAYLWMGKIFDSRKERASALAQYEALLALNCDRDIRQEAEGYKRRPYQ